MQIYLSKARDLMCSGVVPQQPPTMFTSASVENSCKQITKKIITHMTTCIMRS